MNIADGVHARYGTKEHLDWEQVLAFLYTLELLGLATEKDEWLIAYGAENGIK